MDGNVAPVDKIIELAKKYNAMVMIDESHSAGVVGETGRGVTELFNCKGQVEMITVLLVRLLVVLSVDLLLVKKKL